MSPGNGTGKAFQHLPCGKEGQGLQTPMSKMPIKNPQKSRKSSLNVD
jgi:hypothetical protein